MRLYFTNVVYLGNLVFALSVALSIASPTSFQSGHRTDLSPARRGLSPSAPPRPIHSISATRSLTTRHIRQRDWKIDYLDEGWALYYSNYQHYLRIENAAQALEEFFATVADMASGPWLHEEPRKEFTISIGQLALEMKSDYEEIAWDFVAMIAQKMAQKVQNGFTSAFEAYLQHLVSGYMISVRLRTLRDAAPAA